MANERHTPQFDAVKKKIANPQEYLEKLGKEFVALSKVRFATKTDPSGAGWAPWAASTLAARTRMGTASAGILVLTGLLRDSTTYNVSGKTLRVTNNTPYGAFNQYGTERSPARPFIGYGFAERKATAELWSQWINRG